MEDLPPPLIVDILGRLTDSTDLARCRLTSKTLNALSYEVRSINLLCSLSRYLKSRSPDTKSSTTPFKTICVSSIISCRNLESIFFGVEKSLAGVSYDDVEDESDDLHLTDVSFVKEWLPAVAKGLKSLSISDFWIQSCWRKSEVLEMISSCCDSLYKLEVRNAWLSVDSLKIMPNLTSLTLEFIRLDDEDLSKVNKSFPCLEVLNLIGVGGLREPKIHLLHLKTCQWTVSNAPLSLAIIAPSLLKLILKCVRPNSLVLETLSLSDFNLSVEETNNLKVERLLNLENLQLESSNLSSFVVSFSLGRTVKRLVMDFVKWSHCAEMTKFTFETLFDVFPNLRFLELGPGAWSEMESCFRLRGSEGKIGMEGLKEIVAHIVVDGIDETLLFIFSILKMCTNVLDMALLFNRELDSAATSKLIPKCVSHYPKVRWRWGIWKHGINDTWLGD